MTALICNRDAIKFTRPASEVRCWRRGHPIFGVGGGAIVLLRLRSNRATAYCRAKYQKPKRIVSLGADGRYTIHWPAFGFFPPAHRCEPDMIAHSRLLCAVFALAALASRAQAAPKAEQLDFFEKKIRPVLADHCYACHSSTAPKLKGGLRLDTREGIRKGGDTGPAVVPGKPDASLLLKALRYEKLQMPPRGRLPQSVIADFEAWIKAGAIDPRESTTPSAEKLIDFVAAKKFWSFQPPKPAPAPTVRNAAWPLRKIDSFILAKLETAKLEPAPTAEPRSFIRRLYFDLIGLPPTPEQADEFVAEYSANAASRQALVEKVVNELMVSPHYGERWARLWLDVARFAEDQAHIVGADASLTYPNAYLYRDWVIAALNQDMAYDRFVKLQLAADLIAPNEAQHLPALGYLGLGPKYYDRKRLDVMADEWEDRVDVVGRGLLGLTLACARCHNHKFDPIPTSDYYALAGVFSSTEMFNKPMAVEAKKGDKSDGAKTPKNTMHIVREGTAGDLNVFIRGNPENKGPLVKRHFLQVLSAGEPAPFTKGSGRQELGEAIASAGNPLTARVIINRVWAAHFGRGLVASTSNFGTQGDPPSHRELLDDLAVRFVENGWSLKWLHREITLSAAYRQASSTTPAKRLADADNRLLSRMPRQRLSVEAWRDAMLVAADTLDENVGGKSIDPLDPKQHRRTIYSASSRLELNRLLALFDYPDPNIHASRRVETTTPLQKLFVLNSPFMVAQAEALADRLMREVTGTDPDAERQRIDLAYRLLFARPASERELGVGLKFLARDADWKHYAHALLAANEMMFVD
jgi:hypothetical protein